MKTKILYLLLSISIVSFSYAQNKYVNSPEDFYIHTRNHVNNVNRMVDELFDIIKAHPQKWGPVFGMPKDFKLDENFRRDLKEYIRLHDEAKLNTNADFLQRHSLSRPVIAELYEEYGGKAKEEKVLLVNRVDENVGKEFFLQKKIRDKSWRKTFFEQFEHLIDGVERSENPVTSEEMGRKTYKESGRALFKLEKDRPVRAVKLSVMYQQMKEAGVVGTTPETNLSTLPAINKATSSFPVSERKKLQLQSEIAKHMEDRYSKLTVHFDTAKDRYTKLFAALEKAGISKDFFHDKGLVTKLDDFARFELIEKYERAFGNIEKIDDPDLSEKFKKFFFEDKTGKKILLSRANGAPMNFIPKSLVQVKKVNLEIPKKTLNFTECGNLFETIPLH